MKLSVILVLYIKIRRNLRRVLLFFVLFWTILRKNREKIVLIPLFRLVIWEIYIRNRGN